MFILTRNNRIKENHWKTGDKWNTGNIEKQGTVGTKGTKNTEKPRIEVVGAMSIYHASHWYIESNLN